MTCEPVYETKLLPLGGGRIAAMVPLGIKTMVKLTKIERRALALHDICHMLCAGNATPQEIAAFVLKSEFPIYLSHMIENEAHPGTLAEAVFAVLESGETL